MAMAGALSDLDDIFLSPVDLTSLNNGLDLTCYNESPRFSQASSSGVCPGMPDSSFRESRPRQGLDLSQVGHSASSTPMMANNIMNASSVSTSRAEVGLNLSLQDGMNLSRQVIDIGQSLPPQQSHQRQPNEQTSFFYYTTNTTGYTNFSTLKCSNYPEEAGMTNSSSFCARHNNQSSPLNLEHRSSPLNLTNGPFDFTCSNRRQQQGYYDQSNGNMVNVDNYGFGGSSFDSRYSGNFDRSYNRSSQQHSQRQHFSQPSQTSYPSGKSSNVLLEPTNDQYPVSLTYDFNAHVSQQQPSQSHFMESSCAKVRLFCSSCCQEFANTSELNQHMERHNAEVLIENYVAPGPVLDHAAPIPQDRQLNEGDAHSMSWSNLMCQSYDEENACGIGSSEQAVNQQSAPTLLPSVCQNEDLQQQQQSMATVDYSNCAVMPSGSSASANTGNKSTNETTLAASHALPAKMPSILAAPTNNSTKKTDEPAETCSQCAITFASGLDLKKHMDLAHRGRQATAGYQCLICAQELPDKVSHGAHMEAHAREKPFACDECGMRLTNQAGLNRHIRRIHEKKHAFECADCKKRFYERHDLQRHVQRRHKEVGHQDGGDASQKRKGKKKENSGAFPCEICGAHLDTKLAWGCHMWKHTKNSKYIQIEENPGESPASFVPAASKSDDVVGAKKPDANASSQGAPMPNPPKAHLMSYASSSQEPLCLQKSQFLAREVEPTPLNMASNTNTAIVT